MDFKVDIYKTLIEKDYSKYKPLLDIILSLGSGCLMNMDLVLVLICTYNFQVRPHQPIICHFYDIIRGFNIQFVALIENSLVILFHTCYESLPTLCLALINMMLHFPEKNQKHKLFVFVFSCSFFYSLKTVKLILKIFFGFLDLLPFVLPKLFQKLLRLNKTIKVCNFPLIGNFLVLFFCKLLLLFLW